ncbi:hypothetical protein AB6806_09045 [Bosea sp. RCC_152_1]|uniref:hypothetical protein n=1 Tax=Bosea sp. RCC_152_1 TaxID=3239228 RepID=UPI0035255F81
MPVDDFTMTSGEVVRRVFGEIASDPGAVYLQGIRSGRVKEDSSHGQYYRGMLPFLPSKLVWQLKAETPSYDAVVSAPSSRADTGPYLNAVLAASEAKDLSSRFKRLGKYKARDPDVTLDDMIEEFIYTPAGDEPEFKSLVIVDESSSTGKTFAAMLVHLRLAGLSEDCKITVAVWAKLGK